MNYCELLLSTNMQLRRNDAVKNGPTTRCFSLSLSEHPDRSNNNLTLDYKELLAGEFSFSHLTFHRLFVNL